MRTAGATERLLATQRSVSPAEVIEALDDSSPEVARAAISRLVELGVPDARYELRSRLFTADLSLAADLARALKRLGDSGLLEAAIEALTDERYPRRLAAARALRVLADRRAAEPLRVAVHDQIAGVRAAAIEALAELGASRATATECARRLVLDDDAHVRTLAVRTIAATAARPGALLAPAARDRDHVVRLEAAKHLASLPASAAHELLDDPELRVREAAAKGAGPDQVGRLAVMLAEDPSADVRRAAAHTLASFQDPLLADVLIPALGDSDAVVRASVLRALGGLLGREATIKRLREELNGERPERRRAAVYALARLRAPEAARDVARLVGDVDPDVRLAVVQTASELNQDRRAITDLTADGDHAVSHAAEMWLARHAPSPGGTPR
jgi:HEAT repeat protein